jgi:hypothetical protein
MKSWMHATDLHGDKQDQRAVRAFKKHADLIQPDLRIFGGDIWDFRAWRKGADDREKRERVRRDFDAGMEFLRWYEPTHITLGNHDVRLWDQVQNDGPLADYAEDLIAEFTVLMKKLGTVVLPYDKRRGILRIGRMKFAHGFFNGVNAARQMAQAFGSVMFGHGHAIDVASSPSDDRRAARMVGCLCQLDFQYNRAHVATLRQSHGWGYGVLFDNGDFHASQAELIHGKVVVAEGFKVLAA